MESRAIKVHRYPGARGNSRASLLFVHGAYASSGYWAVHFIPFFQSQGYDCNALDLAGHGASGGREALDQFGIDEYAEDVAHAMNEIGKPAVVIGHSMGTLVIQRYLERGRRSPRSSSPRSRRPAPPAAPPSSRCVTPISSGRWRRRCAGGIRPKTGT